MVCFFSRKIKQPFESKMTQFCSKGSFSHLKFHFNFIKMLLTLEEKNQIVVRQYSYRRTAEIFNQLHPDRLPPLNFRTVYQIFKKLRICGTLQRKKWTPSAQSIAIKNQFDEEVWEFFMANPHMTTRRAAVQLGKSHMTIWSILKRMKFWPYKKRKHQKLHEGDPALRKKFCEDLLLIFHLDPGFQKRILWTDEKIFPLNGWFNRQNFRYIFNDFFTFTFFDVTHIRDSDSKRCHLYYYFKTIFLFS